MSKDLLQKRYLVTADYPGNDNAVGSIFTYHDKPGNRDYQTEAEWCAIFDKYPHLFRELQWWEMREINDMPEYARVDVILKNRVGKYVKIIEWSHLNNSDEYIEEMFFATIDNYFPEYSVDGKCGKLAITWLSPATQTDYNNYIKSLKQTV